MPHLVIEFAKPIADFIQPQSLIDAAFSAAVTSNLFNESTIKVRTLAYEHFQCGHSTQQPFVHVNARILSGRTLEQRKLLSALICQFIEDKVSTTEFKSSMSITCDVTDMEKESYTKVVI